MRKLIDSLNDERIGCAVLISMLITFVIAINFYSCSRDHQGVRQPAPELTECSSCSP